jgi:hypothetical protein
LSSFDGDEDDDDDDVCARKCSKQFNLPELEQ